MLTFSVGKNSLLCKWKTSGRKLKLKNKKKSTWNTLLGLKELKEVIQIAKDVDLKELPSICELLPGYKPSKENKIKNDIKQ